MYSDGRRTSGGRIAPLCLAILLCLLTGCGNAAPQTAFDYCQIVIESGEHYGVFGAVQLVPRGSDVSFTIQLTDHKLGESVDYPDYTLTDGAVSSIDGTNYQILTLHQVKYSTVRRNLTPSRLSFASLIRWGGSSSVWWRAITT